MNRCIGVWVCFSLLLPASLFLFNQLLTAIGYLRTCRGKAWYVQRFQVSLVLQEAGNIFIYTCIHDTSPVVVPPFAKDREVTFFIRRC